MNNPEETLFEVNIKDKTVKAINIELDVPLDNIKIYINGVDVNRTMNISSLKIVKVL